MIDRPKLFFCFPYRGVGGVSLLFLRVAEELARRGAADCHLVDYPDGFMARHRDSALTTLVTYEDDGETAIPGDALAVFQSMTPWSIFPGLRLAAGTRLLFWNCHPFNLVPTLPGLRSAMQARPWLARLVLGTLLRGYRARMRGFTQRLLAKRSLLFMDQANVDTTQAFLDLAIDTPRFVPIPAASVTPRTAMPWHGEAPLRVAWIGRIVDFKFHVLAHAMRKLDDVADRTGWPIALTIVGSGDFDARLREVARRLRIDVTFVDSLSPAAVDNFLRREVDLLMAMGTSALEGAKLGVPTILLDVAYRRVPDAYRFTWLHDRTGFTLGDVLGAKHLAEDEDSLLDRLTELREDSSKISQRATSYFQANHSLPTVATAVLDAAGEARCRWGDLVAAGDADRGRIYPIFAKLKKRFGAV